MADALVRELNRLGYQPVFLPRTGVTPPELYSFSANQERLVRHGPLVTYLPAVAGMKESRGKLGDISYKYTSSKKLAAAVSFLETALKCIGISAAPKIDLGFAGSKDFGFAFSDVTYVSVDPSELEQALAGMTTSGLPSSVVEDGRLHIAYEYAYATELLMTRGDKKSFTHDISGDVGSYINLGTSGSVAVQNESTISFKNSQGVGAAFAYKAGKLLREATWVFYPEEVSQKGLVEERRPYVPQRAIVLEVASE